MQRPRSRQIVSTKSRVAVRSKSRVRPLANAESKDHNRGLKGDSSADVADVAVIPSLFAGDAPGASGFVSDRLDRYLFQIISADGRALLTVARK